MLVPLSTMTWAVVPATTSSKARSSKPEWMTRLKTTSSRNLLSNCSGETALSHFYKAGKILLQMLLIPHKRVQ
jgi:hypothetical protein